MGGELRVLQAGDLRLDQPIAVGVHPPNHLREVLLQAPYTAVDRVFDTALGEDVDVLLLTGTLSDWTEDHRGHWYLVEQFSRLRSQGIEIVVAGALGAGPDGDQAWVGLDRFHVFNDVEKFILPVGRPTNVPTVDVRLTSPLGNARATRIEFLTAIEKDAYDLRSIQGRNQQEIGPHGLRLLTINDSGRIDSRFLSTDIVRWASGACEVTPASTMESLVSELHGRMNRLHVENTARLTLFDWTITGQGPLWNQLIMKRQQQLFESLQASGSLANHAWIVGITLAPAESQLTAWHDQSSLQVGLNELQAAMSQGAATWLDANAPDWAAQVPTHLSEKTTPRLFRALAIDSLPEAA